MPVNFTHADAYTPVIGVPEHKTVHPFTSLRPLFRRKFGRAQVFFLYPTFLAGQSFY